MGRLIETPQWASGQRVETFLDRFFEARGWTIQRTTPEQERRLCLGDRIFVRDGHVFNIEYKSGLQTASTGNIFLETVSVDSEGKAGWVYTCQADFIFYACLLNSVILVFVPEQLRGVIEDLKQRFPIRHTGKGQNAGYNTHGVIVPLGYAIEHLARKVINL